MEEIDLREVLKLFWNKKGIIFLITILFMSLGLAYTVYLVKPVYTSSTTLVLAGSNNTTTQVSDAGISTTDITINSKLVSTYSELVKSKNVLRTVMTNLGIEMNEDALRGKIKVNSVKSTELIEISVTDADKYFATVVANEIAKVFTDKVGEIYKLDNVYIVDVAEVPDTPSNINHVKDVLLFTAAGLALAVVYVFLLNLFDTTIKTSEEIENVYNLNVLASIPTYTEENAKSIKGGTKDGKK